MDHLDRYIQQARQHGQTDKEIHADLIDAGWDKEQIEYGLTKPEIPRPLSANANKDHSVGHGEGQEPTQPMPHWQGGFYAFDQAIKAIRRNANPAIFYVAVLAIVSITTSLLVNKSLMPERTHESQLVASSFVATLILLPLSICYPLALAKGIKVTIGELLRSSFKQYFNLIITFILTLVLIVVGGFALIFPLIWIMPWVALMYFVVVDINCGPLVALSEARRLTAHNKGKVWAIIGISILPVLAVSFLRYIPIVGNLVGPMVYLTYTTALAFLYEWLKSNVAV